MVRKEDILQQLRNLLPSLKMVGVRDVALFGSWVRGMQNPNSDVDILLYFDADAENYDNYLAACEQIEKAFLPQKVDIVTANGLSRYLGSAILSEAVYA